MGANHPGIAAIHGALPFSATSLTAKGDAFRIATSATTPSGARGGTVVYAVPRYAPQQLVWFDRAGRQRGTISRPLEESLWEPTVSPDGRLVAANLNWERLSFFDVERGVETTVASPPELACGGDWLPGGQEIVYSWRLFGGDAASTAFGQPGKIECFYAVAPDGRRFAVVKGVGQGTSDVVLADGALEHTEGSGGAVN